jgi:hypothetical protein
MEAPPQSLRDAVRSRVDEMPMLHPDRLPSRRPGGALAPRQESLPVLEAFQEFLDYERRRARRRLVAVMLAFTLILIGLLAGAVFFGIYAFTRFDGQLAAYAHDLEAQEHSARFGIEAVAEDARALRGGLIESRDTLDMMRGAMTSNATLYRAEIARLQERVALLDVRQAALQDDLESRAAAGLPQPVPVPPGRPAAPPHGDTLDVTLELPDGSALPWQIPLVAVPAGSTLE